MTTPVREMTKEEIRSLNSAFKQCKEWKTEMEGYYLGQQDGWIMILGSEGKEYAGNALNNDRNVTVQLPAVVAKRWYEHILALLSS